MALDLASAVALAFFVSAVGFGRTPAPGPPSTGQEVVRAMHDKYAGSWYHTLTFVQTTINYLSDGTSKSETWYEAMTCPGKLRIDILPLDDGNGILFADDTVMRIEKGAVADTHPLIHPLMVLGFDVYCAKPEATVAQLEKLGFDLSVVYEETWKGVPVYVVGAKAGDTRAPQFWIEKERLLFVRMVRPAGKDNAHSSEVVFDKYERAGGGWVAAEVLFSLDGRVTTKEEYAEIRANVDLPDGLFDPKRWREVRWRK